MTVLPIQTPASTVPPMRRPADGPRCDQPEPLAITAEALTRLAARLAELAEGWTIASDQEYAAELRAHLPHFTPGQGREYFNVYARAVQALGDYDDMPESDLRTEFGPAHIEERAARLTDVEYALGQLLRWHPYYPTFAGTTTADPFYMAETIHHLRADLVDERTRHEQTSVRLRAALVANDDLSATVEMLTAADAPVPYVPHLAAVLERACQVCRDPRCSAGCERDETYAAADIDPQAEGR
jgi:hypothetical protein